MRIFRESEKQLFRAEKTIPLGSQTFSKSKTQYPVGISPLFAKKSQGAFTWDVDNNKYIDLVSSLASVTLGYGDREISHAIKKQLKKGVTLSLPTRLESEVSELITELVPSAEMVRFSKNGTDATSAAIRLARSYTGRDHVIVCGYHGWQDWFIGSTTRNKGIPSSSIELTHHFNYNDIESLKTLLNRLENKIAAVIMEPLSATYPDLGFLQSVKDLTKKAGAVLVFDEVVTGFRVSEGGAQQLLGVTPDLSTFGKGLANGFPLSAVVGKKEIMKEMENVFLSGTFGGELLSLAAAKSVLERHIRKEVCKELENKGKYLYELSSSAISENKLDEIIFLSGHPSWKFINWKDSLNFTKDEIKTYFMQEVFQEGILVLNTHNITLAHSKKIIGKVSESYNRVFAKVRRSIENNTLRNELKVPPLTPLFKVR
jgi:glutamate-1-semialdehyde 2,1-aminomutase